jgi:hypothetical protein
VLQEEKEQGHPSKQEIQGPSRGRKVTSHGGWRVGLPEQEIEQGQPRGLEEQRPTKGREITGASQGEWGNMDLTGEEKE